MRNYKTPLQRRHFELIAATLKEAKPDPQTSDYACWRSIVSRFVSVCKCSNGRFDTGRFIRACGED